MNTVLTLAAVAAVTFVTYGAATKFIGPVTAKMAGKAAVAKFSGGVPLTSALMGQAGSSYFWGAAGSLLAGQVAGGLVGSLMEPSVPDLPSYNASPYKYMADYEDPAMQAKLQQDTQNELLKQSVSLENRRRQRYVTFREELMPLGAAGELIPQSAIDKPELLGA